MTDKKRVFYQSFSVNVAFNEPQKRDEWVSMSAKKKLIHLHDDMQYNERSSFSVCAMGIAVIHPEHSFPLFYWHKRGISSKLPARHKHGTEGETTGDL